MAEDWRWTVITGPSSGIGAELATAFAERGKALVPVARRLLTRRIARRLQA